MMVECHANGSDQNDYEPEKVAYSLGSTFETHSPNMISMLLTNKPVLMKNTNKPVKPAKIRNMLLAG